MMVETTATLKLNRDGLGYSLGDTRISGFADDPSLPDGARKRIAKWCKALTPESLDATQRELLTHPATPSPSKARERDRDLSSFKGSPYWQHLDRQERELVDDPSRHPELSGVQYPLTIGELRLLTGASEEQLRSWQKIGLLRASRTNGRHRRFYQDAAMRAFAIKKHLKAPALAVLRDIHEQHGMLLTAIATILHEQAENPFAAKPITTEDRKLLAKTAEGLQRIDETWSLTKDRVEA